MVEAGISVGTASSRSRLGNDAFAFGNDVFVDDAYGGGELVDDEVGNDLFGDRE